MVIKLKNRKKMKKYFLSRYITACLVMLGLILGFAACEDDANDWDVDENKNQMFTPVFFETSRVAATSVNLSFSSVPNARSYVIEFSKDSLKFDAIVNTLEILTEDLVEDPGSTSKRYLATVKDLDASTRYSARIKATANNGLPDSKWGEVTFKTPGEQIISRYVIGESTVRVEWEAGLTVTHLVYTTAGVDTRLNLNPADIAEGAVLVEDLKDNTSYTLDIFNGEVKRGNISFKTLPKVSGDGKKYYLKSDDKIVDYLNGLTEPQVVLVLPADGRYVIDDAWALPEHITSLTLWGLPGEGEEKAYISFKSINLNNSVKEFKIWIHNMEVTGTDASADYILNDNPSAARTIQEFKLDNCNVSAVRGVFRMRGALTVNSIDIDNCIINNIGSYGLISEDAASVSIGNISLSNNTVYGINNTNVMSFKGTTSSLLIDHCTFYSAQAKDRYFANFDGKAGNIPGTFKISNSIFSSSDGSVSVRGTNPKIDGQFVYDSYKTNDYNVDMDKYPLSGILDYSKSSEDLFENPKEGNFKIKDSTIGGESKPGDPRWW